MYRNRLIRSFFSSSIAALIILSGPMITFAEKSDISEAVFYVA